jgi:hypothetical protein
MSIDTASDTASDTTSDTASQATNAAPDEAARRFALAHVDTLHDNVTGAASMRAEHDRGAGAEPALWWLDYLAGQGYQLAEVETQARASFDEVITECLAAEFGNETGPDVDVQAEPESVGSEPEVGGCAENGREDIADELAELASETGDADADPDDGVNEVG